MTIKIEKAESIGFCYGVRRALAMVEAAAREHGGLTTLGAIVHNQAVLVRLAGLGVTVAQSTREIRGSPVAISAHGTTPEVQRELQERRLSVIDTTCPFVRRTQFAARRLAGAGFFVVIYGDASHPEIKGVLGWAENRGLATLDIEAVTGLTPLPRRLGILSQTTQIPARFRDFARSLVGSALGKDSELRIVDTICHDSRRRQAATLEMAKRVDLALIIGGKTSANTNHLAELCAGVTKSHLLETAAEIEADWLKGVTSVGVTSGASTPEATIDAVMQRLARLADA